jgi:hypothetical protein
VLTVAGADASEPRRNDPPGTSTLRAQTSFAAGPQSLSPGPVMDAVVAVSSFPDEHVVAPGPDEVPGGQALHAEEFADKEYEPETQAVHARSADPVPALETNCPGEHVVQSAHAAAFVPAAKLPAPHAAHWRSWLMLPATATYCPGPQSLHATHAAAFVLGACVPTPHDAH